MRAALAWREGARRVGDELELVRAERRLRELADAPGTRCAASLALARLRADAEPRRAYLDAAAALERDPDEPGCRVEARALLASLDAHRPPLADGPDPSTMEPGDLPRAERECRVDRVAVFGTGPTGAPSRGLRLVLFPEGECALEGRPEGERFVVRGLGLRVGEAVPAELPLSEGGARLLRRSDDGFDLWLDPGASATAFDLGSRFLVDVAADVSVDERAARAQGRVIVLDPGHGGDDFGARFDGLRESRLVLDITARAARILERRLPASQVVLTRTRDEIVSLEARTAHANAVGADLFVSVHLNAADEEVRVGGVTTFVLDVTNDRQALRLAARENAMPVSEVTGIQRLLARVHRADQVERSRRLAALVHESTLASGRRVLPGLPDRGVKSAMFYVLVGARMPAILLEASFLTKSEEAAALRTEAYREALASGIAEGIVRYVTELDASD